MTRSVDLSFAQEHLPELLDRVERGEEILMEREGRVGAKLTLAPAPADKSRRRGDGGAEAI